MPTSCTLGILLACTTAGLHAQTILVQPYLQDAELEYKSTLSGSCDSAWGVKADAPEDTLSDTTAALSARGNVLLKHCWGMPVVRFGKFQITAEDLTFISQNSDHMPLTIPYGSIDSLLRSPLRIILYVEGRCFSFAIKKNARIVEHLESKVPIIRKRMFAPKCNGLDRE